MRGADVTLLNFLERQRLMFSDEEMDRIGRMVVFVAGAGGLGSHQALELQRIGVRKIYLTDPDRVELSNLNRQILYGVGDLGGLKAPAAKDRLDAFGLGTEIVAWTERITEETAVPGDVQLILCALDNFESRLALEQVAERQNIPLVHGGVQALYGQITTIIPGRTPALKEIMGKVFPRAAPRPTFSPVVSIIAALQVVEGVKILLGQRDNLVNRLLMMDLTDYSVEVIEL